MKRVAIYFLRVLEFVIPNFLSFQDLSRNISKANLVLLEDFKIQEEES